MSPTPEQCRTSQGGGVRRLDELLSLRFCRGRTISLYIKEHGEAACWPVGPTSRVGRSDSHERARLRGAADASRTARPLAVPSLARPARPALAGAGATSELLVRLPSRARRPHAAGRPPAADRVRGGRVH